MGGPHSSTPAAISRRTLRSMRFSERRAHTASREAAIAAPLDCPAGRDMARCSATDVSSSLRQACISRKPVQAIGGASAGRALFHR